MNKPESIEQHIWDMAYEVNHNLWALCADDEEDKKFWQDTKTIAQAISLAVKQDRESIVNMLEEGYDRIPGKQYRHDGVYSKHDECLHGRYMYQDCEACAIQAIRNRS